MNTSTHTYPIAMLEPDSFLHLISATEQKPDSQNLLETIWLILFSEQIPRQS